MDNKEFLRKLCHIGANKKNINLNDPTYKKRFDEEYSLIVSNDLEDFFLNTSFIINKIKDRGIFVSNGRGSSGGSLVLHLLNITHVDPIEHNLSFSRFLNKARVETGNLPDIDSDIPTSKRREILEMVKEDFGYDKVYEIVNFNRVSPKVAFKDISRALGIDFEEVNNLTKQINKDDSLEDVLKMDIVEKFLERYPQVEKFLKPINGLLRGWGRHAGGLAIFPKPIWNYMGTVKTGDYYCTSLDKSLEGLGIIKNDLLGIEVLDVISDTLEMIDDEIPDFYKDKRVLDEVAKFPLGIFQLQNASGIKYLKECSENCDENITDFEDLYTAIAIIRPGPSSSGDKDKYVEFKDNPDKIEYIHPDLEPILSPTNGVMVYQEQIMEISKVFGGFSDVEADFLRKGVAKKKPEIIADFKEKFKNGGKDKYSSNLMNQLWDMIEGCGDYLFVKSHSLFYGMLAYQCGWLKTYYPKEFLISLANHSNDEKRVKVFNEIKERGITVLNPHINESKKETSLDSFGNIILGLSSIKGVGSKAIKSIISKRPYDSLDDFMMKRSPRQVNIKVIKALIEAGAFDEFGIRNHMYYNVSDEPYKQWTEREKLLREYKMLKLSPNQNLIDYYEGDIEGVNVFKLNEIPEEDTEEFYIQGLINDFIIKEGFNILEISDGTTTASLFVNTVVKERYFAELNDVGKPVLIKCSSYNGNLSLDFFIDLENKEDEKYEKQLRYINKNYVKVIESLDEKYVKVGTIKKIRYFKSKNGNSCVRINLVDDTLVMACLSDFKQPYPLMVSGDIIKYNFDNEPFATIMKVL